nr:tetratricopeptide repeat protein [Pseudomonas sp.]
QGDYARAIDYLQRAWLGRADAEVGVHLGEVFWANGQRNEATEVWRAVRSQDPDNAMLQQTLQRLGVKL